MRVAVLDLGTNTFNLVVAEKNHTGIHFIHSSKMPVKLGEGGINQGRISEKAFQRGVEAINKHYQTIRKYEVKAIRAMGTSALRTAENGKDFLKEIFENTGIRVEIIDGNQEAELIYYGVRETYHMKNERFLILDIGGGSNELIIADQENIYWRKSYPLGIARMLEKFRPSDPVQPEEADAIMAFFEDQTLDLLEEVRRHKVKTLLGASGSFETFASMIREDNLAESEISLKPEAFHIPRKDFETLHQKLINSTLEERKSMPGLEPIRIEMIVLASLFVKFILDKLELTTIYQSNFALKEGVIYQHIKEENNGTNSGD